VPAAWPATGQTRGQVQDRLMRAPFTAGNARTEQIRRRGLTFLLDWLEAQRGATWQERWLASGADAAGAAWRQGPAAWLQAQGLPAAWRQEAAVSAFLSVISADVVRPALGWLVGKGTGPGGLVRHLARARDPEGFARLRAVCDAPMLDLADLGTNPHAPEFGDYGLCRVRFGKASRGSPPKRRSVLTVWPWLPGVLEQWIEEARPQMPAAAGSAALWPSERGERITTSTLNRRFTECRDALGLPGGLDFHSLRRSYVTHLLEDGWDALFVQHQIGHEYASTTALYSCVSSDFRTRTLRRVLDATMTAALQPGKDKR
jgi:hypothetical protein